MPKFGASTKIIIMEALRKFVQKQKDKPLKTKLSDGFTILLIVLFLVPYTRAAIKVQVTKWTMQTPKVSKNTAQLLSPEDLQWQVIQDNGTLVSLNSVNKPVFINFWATWCPPCRAEMPDIQNFYDKYKEKVEFIFISNESEDAIKSYFEKNGFNLPISSPLSSVPKAFAATSIPTTFILDKQKTLWLPKEALPTGTARVFAQMNKWIEE
ncbi:MAG: TlpA family protein disulfide reductase [Bacteroidales bacterium]|nr:TlpA family protein disulfide reductase [Bacteroidales bacterium]